MKTYKARTTVSKHLILWALIIFLIGGASIKTTATETKCNYNAHYCIELFLDSEEWETTLKQLETGKKLTKEQEKIANEAIECFELLRPDIPYIPWREACVEEVVKERLREEAQKMYGEIDPRKCSDKALSVFRNCQEAISKLEAMSKELDLYEGWERDYITKESVKCVKFYENKLRYQACVRRDAEEKISNFRLPR